MSHFTTHHGLRCQWDNLDDLEKSIAIQRQAQYVTKCLRKRVDASNRLVEA